MFQGLSEEAGLVAAAVEDGDDIDAADGDCDGGRSADAAED